MVVWILRAGRCGLIVETVVVVKLRKRTISEQKRKIRRDGRAIAGQFVREVFWEERKSEYQNDSQ
jgi:hypothetical protein